MSEETKVPEAPEVPEVPEEEEHHPVKQSSGSSGAFLATVIALAAAGGSFYLWQQQQAMRNETQSLQQSIASLLNVVEERHNTQLQRINTLAQHHHPDTEEQLARIEALVQDLRGRLGQERKEWAVAEVEYLLRIAEHRLTLEHDKDTALAALLEARSRLVLQDEHSYQPVIRQINADIDRLTAISLPDRTLIAAQLAALSSAVEGWPTPTIDHTSAVSPATEATAPVAVATEESGWRRMLNKVWHDIKGLVTIRHNGEVARPLLEPEQRYFLQQNLQLKLETARIALLSSNSRAYHDSLSEASSWIQRYFDTSVMAVREAQSQIEQLAAVDLEPNLPKLGNSIELLQQAAIRVRPRHELTPVPQPVIPAAPVKEKPEEKASEGTPPASEPETPPTKASTPEPVPQSAEKPDAPALEQSATPPEKPAADVPALPKGNGL